MSSSAQQIDTIEAYKSEGRRHSSVVNGQQPPAGMLGVVEDSNSEADTSVGPNGEQYPTEDEKTGLRKVCGHVPWTAYTIAFVELCERFSYYGTTAVCRYMPSWAFRRCLLSAVVNFIQQPLPDGSHTGAIIGDRGQPGALDLGQRASTGLTLFNQFWAYLMPLLGAYMADTFWGRYLTIQISIGIAIIGHILLVIASTPALIQHPNSAIGLFAVGLVIFGIGVGGFKSNISPLIAEQYESKHPKQIIKVLKSGERVIVDPNMTITRIYM